jgi:two-component system OmpR family sensor kinase
MGVVALLLVVAAAVVIRTTSSQLVDQVDAQLVQLADPDADGRGRGGEPWHGPPPDGGIDPGEEDYTTVYLGVFYEGELVTEMAPRTRGGDTPVPLVDVATAEALVDSGGAATVESSTPGVRYRVIARAEGRSGATIVFGLPLDNVDASVDRLVVVELVAIGGVLVVLAVITWWVLRLGVQPIRRMTGAATTIAAGDLSARVPEAPAGTEAAELGDALNVMLERIEAAFDERAASEDRLRRFVADASHELRTPVTTVRGYAELFRMGGLEDHGKLVAAMARTEAESVRMGRLVDDMLTLARLDRGVASAPEDVRLDTVVADAAADLRVVHPDHPVTVTLEPALVSGSPDQLHQVVANLLTNAAVHTPAGTAVRAQVSRTPQGVRLVVADDGPGMDDQTAERFYRADPSRSRASGGSGLGLSIVAAIVAAHGGTVRIARADLDPDAAGTGTTVVVELPGTGA